MASNSEIDQLEKRQNRIEDAIERLTEISADLNKMLAVHDQRLTQQERTVGIMEETVERRREEIERKVEAIYAAIKNVSDKCAADLETFKKEQKEPFTAVNTKVDSLQKIIWTYLGGFSVIVFIITYGPKILEVFGK